MREILRVEQLASGYGGRDVIGEITFSLRGGELCALLGGNGAGKTTLLKAVCTLLPSRGELRLGDQPLRDMDRRERARHIGYLAQGGRMGLSLETLDVVLMGLNPVLGLLEAPNQAHRRRAMEVLEWAGIAHLSNTPFQNLSAGQKQLVLFARTLVCDPELLVLDEPDSALDLQNRGRMFGLLGKYLRSGERAVLLCSHDVNAALGHAHRLLLMKGGTLAYDLSMADVSREELERALEDVYGPVEVLCHRGKYLMMGGDGT